MAKQNVVKDSGFDEVGEVRTDSKSRIALGRRVKVKAQIYKVYQNSLGQIVLDPQVSIPAHEAWLFKNKEATARVQSGLEDAKKGRVVKSKADYSQYLDESK